MTQRWAVTIPSTSAVTVFPRNPYQRSSPNPPRNITSKPGGMALERNRDAYEWTFNGRVRTQAQYTLLRDLFRTDGIVHLTDHLNITWIVRFGTPVWTEKTPTPLSPWRFEYQAKVICYGRLP